MAVIMTAPANWPNPERPGVPMFPERDGLHIVLGPFDENPALVLWKFKTRTYLKAGVEFTPEELLGGAIIYHGPCLTPTQISEMLAGERERCVDACRNGTKDVPTGDAAALAYNVGRLSCVSDIRNPGAAS